MRIEQPGSSSFVPENQSDFNTGLSNLFDAPAIFSPDYLKEVISHAKEGRGADWITCPPCYVGPSNILANAIPDFQYSAGLDTLCVSFWLSDKGRRDFLRMLQDFKDEFNLEKFGGPEVSERALDIGWKGLSFNMQRVGAREYPYKLQTGDITLLFSNHNENAPFPNCRLEIGSKSCWLPGWWDIYCRFVEMLDHLGISIKKEITMRQDLTVDLAGVDFSVTGLENYRRWVKKSRRFTIELDYDKPSSVYLSKGSPLQIRCYHKTVELIAKQDAVKKEFFYRYWFDKFGYVPEHVTRIEIQILREVSKELGVHTVADLRKNLNSIWRYCVGGEDQPGWAKFCSRDVTKEKKNKNYGRIDTAILWQMVQDVRFSDDEIVPIKRTKIPPQVDVERLKKQGSSCLMNACAASGLHPDDLDGHIKYCFDAVFNQLTEFYQRDRTEYVRKIETGRNKAINTMYRELYRTAGDSEDSFAKHDRPRQYYRTKSNTYTKVYCTDSKGQGYWETVS